MLARSWACARAGGIVVSIVEPGAPAAAAITSGVRGVYFIL